MILFLIKLVFSGLALWWGTRQIDFSHLYSVLKGMPVHVCGAAFFLMCLSISINGFRLYFITKCLKLNYSFKKLHQITWIGTFFNQLLPGGIGGDAYRIYYLAKDSSMLRGITAVIWDRTLGILCMSLLSAPLLLLMKFPNSIWLLVSTIYGLIFVGIIFLAIFAKHPILQKYKLMLTLHKILSPAKSIACNPPTLVTTIAQAVINFFVFYLIVVALKTPLNFAESTVLFTMSLLIVMIPISVSGWGLRESFMTAYFIAIGLPPEMGFTLGVLQGLLTLSTGSIGAAFYLFAKKSKNLLANSDKKDIISTSKAGVAQG